MTERQCLKKINSLVLEYVTQKIIAKRSTHIYLKYVTSLVLVMHKKDTIQISKKIYDLKDTSNGMSIFTILDNYSELLLKDFDEIKYEQFDGVKFSDVTKEIITPIDMFSIVWKVVKETENNESTPKYDCKDIITLYGNQAKYPVIFENQAIVLETYKKLAKELNITSSLDLSHYFTKLLWEGYFSPTKEHSYQLRDRIIEFPTLEVFQGKGVCLNYSAMQTQFLKICGKDAKQVGCYVDTKAIEYDKKYKVLLECNSDISKYEAIRDKIIVLAASPLIKVVGNHAITLVGDDNRIFYYDPTNLFVLNPVKNNKASIVNGKGEFNIKLDYTLKVHDFSKIEKIEDYLADIIVKNTTYETFSDEEIYESMTAIFNRMNENSSLINDTYEEIKPNILKINEEIDKHKDDFVLKIKKR